MKFAEIYPTFEFWTNNLKKYNVNQEIIRISDYNYLKALFGEREINTNDLIKWNALVALKWEQYYNVYLTRKTLFEKQIIELHQNLNSTVQAVYTLANNENYTSKVDLLTANEQEIAKYLSGFSKASADTAQSYISQIQNFLVYLSELKTNNPLIKLYNDFGAGVLILNANTYKYIQPIENILWQIQNGYLKNTSGVDIDNSNQAILNVASDTGKQSAINRTDLMAETSKFQNEINTNKTNIATNKTNVAINKTDIINNQNEITTNKTNITTNKTNIVVNKKSSDNNNKNITANKESIDVLTTELQKRLTPTDVIAGKGIDITKTSNTVTIATAADASHISSRSFQVGTSGTFLNGAYTLNNDDLTFLNQNGMLSGVGWFKAYNGIISFDFGVKSSGWNNFINSFNETNPEFITFRIGKSYLEDNGDNQIILFIRWTPDGRSILNVKFEKAVAIQSPIILHMNINLNDPYIPPTN